MADPFSGAVAAVAGPAISGLFSGRQAKKQRAFQQKMSNTSYQRGMRDMRRAGLNPMLAFSQGGASTPGGAMGSMPAPDFVGSAMAFKKVDAELDAIESGTDKATADAERARAERDLQQSRLPEADTRKGWVESAAGQKALHEQYRMEAKKALGTPGGFVAELEHQASTTAKTLKLSDPTHKNAAQRREALKRKNDAALEKRGHGKKYYPKIKRWWLGE